MSTTEKAERRPFHETIVDAIRSTNYHNELGCLIRLISVTKIPKGHDEIIAALEEKCRTIYHDGWESAVAGVKTGLLEQKAEAEREEAFESLALGLDELWLA